MTIRLYKLTDQFQSTPPARRATHTIGNPRVRGRLFQSTPPARRATIKEITWRPT